MKRHQLYLLFFFLKIIYLNSVQAQSEIYQYHIKSKKIEQIGKCDSNYILLLRKNNSEIIGKFIDSLIYEKLPGKNRWKVVGMFKDSCIYKNYPLRNRWVCIGKYRDGFIYKKGRKNENWILIGKYSNCVAGGAYLLFFYSNESDSGSSVILF
jgi:hypothetical protein